VIGESYTDEILIFCVSWGHVAAGECVGLNRVLCSGSAPDFNYLIKKLF